MLQVSPSRTSSALFKVGFLYGSSDADVQFQLAIATLGVTFAGSYIAMSSGEKKPKEQKPPVNASSKEEEAFIQYA